MNSSGATRGGVLYLAVGPSGVGKDTLLAGARQRLSATHHFARRVITRPADAGGEDHVPVDEAEFAAMAAAGAFALHWSAHGLRYGILESDTRRLADGIHVVANVSRATVAQARLQFPRLRVVHVTASGATLRERLRQRGREMPKEIEARLARAAADAPTGADVLTVRNDGAIEEALASFIEALRTLHAADKPNLQPESSPKG